MDANLALFCIDFFLGYENFNYFAWSNLCGDTMCIVFFSYLNVREREAHC